MSKIDDVLIRTKMIAAFAVLLAVTIALGLLAIQRLSALNDNARDIRDNWLVATRALGDFKYQTMRYRQLQAAHILSGTDEEAQKELDAMNQAAAEADKVWKLYEPTITPGDESALADKIHAAWNTYLADNNKLLQLDKKHDIMTSSALYKGELRTRYNTFADDLSQDIELNTRGAHQAVAEGEAVYALGAALDMVGLGLAALVCLLAGWMVVARVSRPIGRMTEGCQARQPDLETEIEGVGRKDEIGQMAAAVQVFKDNMIEADRLAAEQEDKRQGTAPEGDRGINHRFEREVQETLEDARLGRDRTALDRAEHVGHRRADQPAVAGGGRGVGAGLDQCQTVASATEELTASIAEISRQASQSSTDREARRSRRPRAPTTRCRVSPRRRRRIGEVVELINGIAVADQSAGAQRHDRGGARRRGGQGLRRGRLAR